MFKHLPFLTAPCAALVTSSLESESSQKNRPVNKVINLMKNMQTELTADQEADNQIKQKFDCWSKEAMKTTSDVITTSRNDIKQAEQVVANAHANSGGATARIANLQDELTTLRGKMKKTQTQQDARAKAFFTEHGQNEKDLVALKNAKKALQGKMGLVQQEESLAYARRVLKSIAFNTGKVSSEGMSLLSESESDVGDLKAPGSKSYNGQSGKILGIIEAMITDMTNDSGEAIEQNKVANEAFNQIMSEMRSQEESKSTLLAQEKSAAADAAKKMNDAKNKIITSTEALDNALKYKQELALKIDSMNTNMQDRTSHRNEELSAIRDVLEMLTSDESRDLFGKTTTSDAPSLSFLQRSATSSSARRQSAVALIQKATNHANAKYMNGIVALLQQQGTFTAVYKAIDDNVKNLNAKMKQETDERDQCNADFQVNAMDTKKATNSKNAAAQQSSRAGEDIQRNTEDINLAEVEIGDMQNEILRLSAERESENAEFQTVVTEQRATVDILNKVMTRLREVYEPKKAALIAQQNTARPQSVGKGPGDFVSNAGGYEQNSQSKGVLFMIEKIASDSQAAIDEAMSTEKQSQAQYETLVMDANKAVASTQNKIENLQSEKADNEATKAEQDNIVKSENKRIEDLGAMNDALHQSCDFLIKYYDQRQSSQQNEIDTMMDAKRLLKGMAPGN